MTSIERVVRIALVSVALVSLPAPAFAKNPEAIVHFELGRKLVREGKWNEAATEFEKSLALEQAVGPLLNLANAYEKLGRLTAAVRTFRSAQELAARTPGDEARAAEAAGRAHEVEEKLPTISVAAEAGVSLEIEGLGSIQSRLPDRARKHAARCAPKSRGESSMSGQAREAFDHAAASVCFGIAKAESASLMASDAFVVLIRSNHSRGCSSRSSRCWPR